MNWDAWIPEHGSTRGDGITVAALEPEDAATNAAEEYFKNHDGWEFHWPLEFAVSPVGSEDVTAVVVDMEAKPMFYGRRK